VFACPCTNKIFLRTKIEEKKVELKGLEIFLRIKKGGTKNEKD